MSSLLLAVLLSAVAALAQDQAPVPVTVYYESLCSDSIKFVTTQLYPTWTALSQYINVTFVPFGKTTFNRTDGVYNFNCHHGAKECMGNKVHACALKKIQSKETQVKFINCLMTVAKDSPKDDAFPSNKCANETADFNSIDRCSTSPDGDAALADFGTITNNFESPLTSVPYVVLNNAKNPEDKKLAVSDFKSAVCSYIKGKKPAECDSKNGASSLAVGVLPLLATLLLATRQ